MKAPADSASSANTLAGCSLSGQPCVTHLRRPYYEAEEHLHEDQRYSWRRIQLTSSLNFFALLVSSRKANIASRPA